MSEDGLSVLEERIGKLIELTIQLKEERRRWEEEKTILKSQVERIAQQVEKVIGEE